MRKLRTLLVTMIFCAALSAPALADDGIIVIGGDKAQPTPTPAAATSTAPATATATEPAGASVTEIAVQTVLALLASLIK
jgi:hypothetical protein